MEQEVRMKSPDTKVLAKIIMTLRRQLRECAQHVRETIELEEIDAVDVQEALEWVSEHLAKRRDYHKGRQVKMKTERQLMEEALRARGVDMDALRKRIKNGVADALIDSSDEEPVFPREDREDQQ